MTRFGQLVVGPPGSGKTTYCNGMQQFLNGIGRKVAIVNLDPANENIPYTCDIDISELITLEDVMSELKLGPNGGLVYCMEFLQKNIAWLQEKLKLFPEHYLIFDCPGQVELYTHHDCIQLLAAQMQHWDVRVAAVHLSEASQCSEPGRFIAAVMTALSAMVRLELPHVNVLSKADLIENTGELDFGLDFFTEVLDLNYLTERLSEDRFFAKYRSLNQALSGVIEDYGLVSFVPLIIQDKRSLAAVLKQVDRANGCGFGDAESRDIQHLLSAALGHEAAEFEPARDVQEKYMQQSTNDTPGSMDFKTDRDSLTMDWKLSLGEKD